MHLVNRSSFWPSILLLPLIDAVRRKTQYAELATLLIEDRWDGEVTGGYSWKRPSRAELREKMPGTKLPSKAAPSLVKLDIPHNVRYPRTSYHVREVGMVRFKSWDEEVVFVLAHELRHIDQFYTRVLTDHLAEVDAEKFAVSVLRDYRKHKKH